MNLISQGPSLKKKSCRHNSTRRDGTLNNCCLICGEEGYWHFGHRHDILHPSGNILITLHCPKDECGRVYRG